MFADEIFDLADCVKRSFVVMCHRWDELRMASAKVPSLGLGLIELCMLLAYHTFGYGSDLVDPLCLDLVVVFAFATVD